MRAASCSVGRARLLESAGQHHQQQGLPTRAQAETGVVFVTPDYWPLPWYMRDYPKAGFFGSIVDTEEAMIVANINQEAELAPTIADSYDRVGVFNLRPGVDLVLYVRNDIPKA